MRTSGEEFRPKHTAVRAEVASSYHQPWLQETPAVSSLVLIVLVLNKRCFRPEVLKESLTQKK
jgi:hypothetical protein